MFYRKLLSVFAALGLVVALSGCDKSSSDDAKQGTSADQTDKAGGAGATDARTITLEPVGNQMKYATTELTAKAGEKIHLVFKNVATSSAMKHNVVFLNTDDDSVAQKVSMAGAGAKDSEYVPDHEAVLAATDVADPGETVEVTFTVPEEPGKYQFICTFPGHYSAGMTGTLVVEG